MADTPRRFEKYSGLFEAHMQHVDQLQQVIINGHLIIEAAFDNILGVVFFNPQHLAKARLSFSQKMHIVRALASNKDNLQPWTIISSVNAVRNELAHNLGGEKRTEKIDQLLRLFKGGATERMVKATEGKPNHYVVYAAIAECIGFLGALEEDLTSLRRHIDVLGAALRSGQDDGGRDKP